MNELINNPLFQSAVAPFTAAFFVSLFLSYLRLRWMAVAVVLGFYTAVALMMDVQLLPLTSTRKILLLVAVSAFIGFGLDYFRDSLRLDRGYVMSAVILFSLSAVVWILWPVWSRRSGLDAWVPMLITLAYTAWLVYAVEHRESKKLPTVTTGLMLAIATALCTLFAASALIAQLAGAMAAAIGGFLLVLLIRKQGNAGQTFIFPVILGLALLASASLVYANLSWAVLVFLAMIPGALYVPEKFIPIVVSRSDWLKTMFMSFLMLPPALVAIILSWWISGGVPL